MRSYSAQQNLTADITANIPTSNVDSKGAPIGLILDTRRQHGVRCTVMVDPAKDLTGLDWLALVWNQELPGWVQLPNVYGHIDQLFPTKAMAFEVEFQVASGTQVFVSTAATVTGGGAQVCQVRLDCDDSAT